MGQKNRLWYKNPAQQWIEALPIGNGRMGAMVYGGTLKEKVQIDESSFWSGAPSENNSRPGTKQLMEKIRAELLKEDYEKADELGHDFVGNKNQYGTNMPVGELKLEICGCQGGDGDIQDYVRYLDLESGLAGTEFTYKGSRFFRECFVSDPAQVFCMKVETEEPFEMEIRYEGIGNNTLLGRWDGSCAEISGDALETLHSDGKHGVHLEGCVKVLTDGRVSGDAHCLKLSGAKKAEFFIDLETTMFLENPGMTAKERAQRACEKGYDSCREEHVRDVRGLFARMDISLGQEEKNELPTDVRLANMAKGEEDLALYALMYQYGRYLLIASSREDSPLPTHMGGIWNDNIYNNIDCTQDMHIDMNLQMQYWASAVCSLPECYQPFFRYMENVLVPSGRKTAKVTYEADGWTAHVVSNPWGFTSLGWAYNWGVWSLGGAWCAVMIWDYYEYARDREFLEKRGFPMLEDAVRFVLDYVFFDEKSGYYMTGPSYSPENQFGVNGKNYFLALSNTCDVILVRELLQVYEKAVQELDGKVSGVLLEKARKVLKNLPPYQIGKKGQVQEWFYDFEEPIPNHRHTSHLLGLYPFCQILPERDTDLAEAARVSIRNRCEDFEITSWGMNMLLGYYARLRDGEKSREILRETFKRIVRCNLASVMDDEKSMWRGTWELDGNTGLTAAMSEMFVQSSENTVTLLPALPGEWKDGYLLGISLKNGGKADIWWENGKLKKAVIYPGKSGSCKVCCGNKTVTKQLNPDETWEIGETEW
ncbi:glycoside hydrolase N-terminal domain-containing protein [Ruminococcus sp. 5_1_39BFAA]|uniref:glycoside hydrolase family 95 protein n=1 Tax=Ruminococcus sp. 5_1_39BFAA TaxID=457412 RepID=UPI00356159E1